MRTSNPSITWLGMSGDLTLVWDEKNKDKIIEFVKKKMEQGYSFFAINPRLFDSVIGEKKTKITEKNFNKVTSKATAIVVPDKHLNELLQCGIATVDNSSVQAAKSIQAIKRLKDARDVVKQKTVAIKQIAGG